MSDSTGYNFPANVSTGHIFQNLKDGGTYRFIGGNPALSLSWILIGGELSTDPDTSTWTANQAGARWFNKVEQQYKGWNGIQIVLVG